MEAKEGHKALFVVLGLKDRKIQIVHVAGEIVSAVGKEPGEEVRN